MKLLKYSGLMISASIFVLFVGCESVINGIDDNSYSDTGAIETLGESPWKGLMATGEFLALWQGCEDGHEEPPDHEEGGCQGGGHDGDHEDEDHIDDGHDGVVHGGNRPARDFYVQFNAQLKKNAKGHLTFLGINEYKGVGFTGNVSWVERGRNTNELFFGGKILDGTVSRKCFLFSVQDNGEGSIADTDRLQYRLYGSGNAPCHVPDHFPKGYPIAIYDGNLKVH